MIKEIPSADTNYVMWEAILNKFPEKTRIELANRYNEEIKLYRDNITKLLEFLGNIIQRFFEIDYIANPYGSSGFTVPPAHEKRSSDAKKRTFGEQPLSSVPPRGRFISNPNPTWS
ncbi:hypothetical protein L596_001047 [Steinernema carpocapsae]|uniref:Uncharacterized protein n=1 Tax=Steinernema carpocapsae TaxID=34508 RepID=A0A4U8UP45_STECR|nr:hypothetical protein L596_001047 [Steinernema carpocapsae]